MCERKSHFSASRGSFITSNRFWALFCWSIPIVCERHFPVTPNGLRWLLFPFLHCMFRRPQPKHPSQGNDWIWPSQHKHFAWFVLLCFSPFVLLFLLLCVEMEGLAGGKGNVKPAVKRSVIWRTFKKNTGSVCFFVFLCIKRLNFSSLAVRQGMHGRQESKFFPLTFLYRDELFSDSISNKYATHLISFLPPSCNPSICARRQVSAFHQVNTPISSDNDTGKEGHNLNFQCLETVQHKLGEDSHFCSWWLIFFFPS